MNHAWVVFRKELSDALRDRRTWIVVLITSLAAGPLTILLVSRFVADLERTVARREVFISKPAAAPTLVNFIQRAGGNVREAPADYRERIKRGELESAVVVVPDDFESRLARGETIRLDVEFDASGLGAREVTGATLALLRGFSRELGAQRLLARGVSPQVLVPVEPEPINLASSRSRAAQTLLFLPLIALAAAVIGALSVAIDVTAGERERGSLEPLLMNPVAPASLVVGKWAVVASSSAAVVVLTLIGYFAAFRLIPSESMAAVMQFGGAEGLLFLGVMLPFSAMIAAVMMLAAIYGRTHKEAQVYMNYVALVINFAPMTLFFIPPRDVLWQKLVPAIAQQSAILRGLRGDAIGAIDILLPALVAFVIAAAALAVQARLLVNERMVFSK